MRAGSKVHGKHQLQSWLGDKPVEWSRAIAVRAALRVVPLISGEHIEHLTNPDLRERLLLAAFRACFISWFAVESYRIKLSAAAHAAANAATKATRIPARAPARAAAYAALAAAKATAATNAAQASAFAADGVKAANSLWQSASIDVGVLITHGDAINLLRSPVWNEDSNPPEWMRKGWRDLKSSVSNQSLGFTSWIAWYEALLPIENGAIPRNIFGKSLALRIALQPEEWWARGAKAVDVDITRWLEEQNRLEPLISSESKIEVALTAPVSARYRKLIFTPASRDDWRTAVPSGLSITSVSKRFRFAGVKRAPAISNDEFESALEELAESTGVRIAPEFCYERDQRVPGRRIPLGDFETPSNHPSEDEAWFDLDDVLSKILTGKQFDNQHTHHDDKVILAIIDSGIDGSRLEFQTPGKMFDGWGPVGYNPWHDEDEDAHGTMCAAIAAASDKTGGRFRGVAPSVQLFSGRSPDLTDADLVAIYDEKLIPLAKQGYTIIANHSFGYPGHIMPARPAPFTFFSRILNTAAAAGIHMVFSAGNNHHHVGGGPDACAPNSIWQFKGRADVLTVGASTMDDKIWWYSSRGPGQTLHKKGHAPKPDVVAPTPRNGLILGPDGGYVAYENGWGTSGAAALASGLLALLLSIRRDLPRDELYDIVRQTAAPLASYGRTCQGHGVINCDAAIERLKSRTAGDRRT